VNFWSRRVYGNDLEEKAYTSRVTLPLAGHARAGCLPDERLVNQAQPYTAYATTFSTDATVTTFFSCDVSSYAQTG
jgi:hypothetical protein